MLSFRRSVMAAAMAAMLAFAGVGPAAAKVFGTGKFSGRNDYSVSGKHKIVINDGKKRLRFNKAFQSDGGPGLRVWLSKAGPKAGDSALDDKYIDLGSLKSASGKQKYKIPKGKKLRKYKSVVVWCSRVEMAFGVAPIKRS